MSKHFGLVKWFRNLVNEFRISSPRKLMGLKQVLQSWRWLMLGATILLLCIAPGFSQENLTVNTIGNTASASRGTTITVTRDKALS